MNIESILILGICSAVGLAIIIGTFCWIRTVVYSRHQYHNVESSSKHKLTFKDDNEENEFIAIEIEPGQLPLKHKSKVQDYEERFLTRSNTVARQGKTTYIRREYLKCIQTILPVIGRGEISTFNYIDSILSHHFSKYQDKITELHGQNNQSIFQ